jgi:phosphoglycerate dehydrogenase-like enzyme
VKVLYPTNVDDVPTLPEDVTLARFDPTRPIPAEHHDAEVLVSWGSTTELMRAAARQLSGVRWVQGLAAGPDDILAGGFGPDVVITSGRSLHNETVAEHALALILAGLRGVHLLVAAQPAHRWRSDLGGTRVERADGRLETLFEANVLIWGFGGIGQTLAPLLRALGAQVTGVAHQAGDRAGYPVIGVDRLPEALPSTDVLVMILPHAPDTKEALNAELLGLLPSRAWLVNVGRGSTVDEDALAQTLRAGGIAGAALDVFRTEPLPADSPLWELPNVIISPHSAGGRPRAAASLVEENLRAFRTGQPMRNVVPR